MSETIHDPHQKAAAINRSRQKYGTIAEIGAGQETARWFFRVGGAAGTIAKTMSAYDMTFSDAIYGSAPRYVCRERLQAMLEVEYNLLLERLATTRGSDTTFFAFANTVAARSYSHKTDGQGWLGIRFQTHPNQPPSQIELHVNLHGKTNLQDQETLGLLGVNLIYGALMLHEDPTTLLNSLQDNVHADQAELDMIDFSGPAFTQVDNRLMALQLVEQGMSDAAMFTADGRVAQVADVLWQRPVLIERSRFRPPTHLTVDLLEKTRQTLKRENDIDDTKLVVLAEMTLNNLCEENGECVDTSDFLNRADILAALGMNVLISNYGEYYRLAQYLFRYTRQPIAIAMGLPSLYELFDEKHYEDLPGGILESFGRLFRYDLRLYVCPMHDQDNGNLIGLDQFQPAEHLQNLLAHLQKNGYIHGLESIPTEYLKIYSHEVLRELQAGNKQWESSVPANVAELIKAKRLFGFATG
ncbi:MAG: hypothetical protein PVG75_06675 [Thioalkalispiraceae bacterium]|jgi:hypothetical protein